MSCSSQCVPLVKSYPGRLTLSWQDKKIKHFQLSWQYNNIPGRLLNSRNRRIG